jgi:hypothetical protein
MRCAAVALTIGRPQVRGFLWQLSQQTMRVPTLLWADGEDLAVDSPLSEGMCVIHGGALGSPRSIGLVRRAAVAHAIHLFELGDDDGLILLDDDDFYSSRHLEVTAEALSGAAFVGAQRFGIAERGQAPVVCEDAEGMGLHGTWGVRVGTYLDAGGYQDDRLEEVCLARRIGVSHLVMHRRLTHVRRLHDAQLSQTVSYDREALRTCFLPVAIGPEYSPELSELEAWCATRFEVTS